ncbi:MAG: NAD-dependent epimerase/dehydratase family protein [Patescibacteria group bacterium]
MKGKRNTILVIGGAGYVGSALVPALLDAGFCVKVLDLFLYGRNVFGRRNRDANLELTRGDIRDKEIIANALSGVDCVIHLASVSNDPSFELDRQLGKSINYDATVQLIDLSKIAGVSRFILASTSSVYGVKKEKKVTEDLPLEPLTDYSKYKAFSEAYLLTHAGDMVAVVLRPATVCGYAPRMRLDLTVNLLTVGALVKKHMTILGGSQYRPNIHIQDMVRAYKKMIKYPKDKISGNIYNVGYENYSILDIAHMIKKVLKDSSITIEMKPTNDLRSYRIDSGKIKKELGFTPVHSVEEAIVDIARAYHSGRIPSPLDDIRYSNIKTMQAARLQ